MAILVLFVGCCLMWVAVHGTQASTPWGVFQEITGALGGTSSTGREESATTDSAGSYKASIDDPTAGRTNEPAGPA